MANTESNIVIKYVVDDSALVNSNKTLADTGKVLSEDVKKYDELKKKTAELDAENQDLKKSIEDLNKKLGEAGNTTDDAGDSFLSLGKQLKKAKDDYEKFVVQFGEGSKEAENAKKKYADLKESLSNVGKSLSTIKPEEKIAVFSKFGQTISGAFQTATGVLQAFGIENEKANEIAQRLQAGLNIAQGLSSVVQLKDAYKDVKSVLGFTATAQATLNTAQVAGATSTGVLSTAFRGLSTAIASTGVGAVVIALGALAGILLTSSSNTDTLTESEKNLKEANDKLNDSINNRVLAELELLATKDPKFQKALEQKKLEINSEKEIAKAKEEYNEKKKKSDKAYADASFLTSSGLYEYFSTSEKDVQDALKQTEIARQTLLNVQQTTNAKAQTLTENQNKKDKEDADKKAQKDKEDAKRIAQQKLDALKKLKSEEFQILQETLKGTELDAKDELQRFEVRFRNLDVLRKFEEKNADALGKNKLEINARYNSLEKELTNEYYAFVKTKRDKDKEDAKTKKEKELQEDKDLIKSFKDLVDQQANIEKRNNALIAKDKKDLAKLNFDTDTKAIEDKLKFTEQGTLEEKEYLTQLKELKQKYNKDIQEIDKESSEKQKKTDEDLKQKKLANAKFVVDSLSQISNTIIDSTNEQYEKELSALQDQLDNKIISEEEYEAKLRPIKQRQAEANKRAQIAQATINLAQGILNALGTTPPNLVPFAVALASSLGAINLAKIISTPIPAFNKGTLSVNGVDMGKDSVHAMLRPGEAVIPVDINKAYHPAIKAIYKKQISPTDINSFVLNRMSGKSSIGRDTAITANLDTFALSRAISKSKSSVEVANADFIGKVIAKELMKSYNPRR
jgi:hypothetical protein